MSFQSQLWIMAGLLLIAVVYLLWSGHRPVTAPRTCAVCQGTFNVDSTCESCQKDIHAECWDRHLCKYRIN